MDILRKMPFDYWVGICFFCAFPHRIFCGLFIHNIVPAPTAFKDNTPLLADKNSFFLPTFIRGNRRLRIR